MLVGPGSRRRRSPTRRGDGQRPAPPGIDAPRPAIGSPAGRCRGDRSVASSDGAGRAAPPVEHAHRASLATQPAVPSTRRPRAANGTANGVRRGRRAAARGPRRPRPRLRAPKPPRLRRPGAGSPDRRRPTAPDRRAVTTGRRRRRRAADRGRPAGASLSLDDLCAASGLSAEDVGQLQEFGLLTSTVAAGVEFFDEEALTVATVAAKFAAFGVEARHLRLYKNAADREAGFIEQIVIPMVRQRNPEARARATQTAEELARLGQQMKASLLRTALRDIL